MNCHDFLMMWISFLHKFICTVTCSVCHLFCISLSESRSSQWHFSDCRSVQCIFPELLKAFLLYLMTVFSSTSHHSQFGTLHRGRGGIIPVLQTRESRCCIWQQLAQNKLQNKWTGGGPTHLQLTFYSLVCYGFCILQYSQLHCVLLRGFQRMITIEPSAFAITHSDTAANNVTFLILKCDFAMCSA